MIDDLAKVDGAVKFQHGRIRKSEGEHTQLLELLDAYLAEYVRFYRLSSSDVLKEYYTFVNRYVDDLKAFESTGLFPFQRESKNIFDITRTTYDIFLIMSSLLQKHRFEIMRSVYETKTDSGNCLIVGVGSGLEIALLREKFEAIDAYDLSMSAFCRHKFGDLNLYEERFVSCPKHKYNAIYAIEFLEHLEDPYKIMGEFSRSVTHSGTLVVTTARNVPQFDHLYNFSDEHEFEQAARGLGFHVLHKEIITHNYVFFNVDASNCLYVLQAGS